MLGQSEIENIQTDTQQPPVLITHQVNAGPIDSNPISNE